MFVSKTKVRVRYSETDMMGYCYYGNYAAFFEVARVEAIRGLGFSYKQMEDEGVALPVLDFSIKYYKPAFYDDELTNDNDYLPESAKRWTSKRYDNKLRKLGFAISNIGKEETGKSPALIGLAEVENNLVIN